MSDAEEVWPRWIANEGWARWDHSGCSHDSTNGDREACRRLNRARKPGGPDPEWREAVELSRGHDARAFLNRFVQNMEAERDLAYGEDEPNSARMAEIMVAIGKLLHRETPEKEGDAGYLTLQLFYAIALEYAEQRA